MPSPCPAYRPDWATPNARALVSGRSACTNAAAAVAAWMGDRGPLALAGPPAFAPDPGLAGLGPELRRHGLARPQASARPVCGVCPVSPSSMHMPPGHPVTPAKIFGGCHHCVIAISLTVSDAADLCKRYDPESRPTWPRSIRFAGSWCLPICWGGPDGGLMPSTAAKPTAPPSSSGLGHRPFKAAARVRIPLGARPDQEAARALAAMRWRVSRARRPGRAAGAPGRGPPGSAAPWTSSSGRRRRDRPRPARSAAVAASQRRMMQPESRAHQRSARFGMGGQFISAERAGRLVLPNGLAGSPSLPLSHAGPLWPPGRRSFLCMSARLLDAQIRWNSEPNGPCRSTRVPALSLPSASGS